MIRSRTRRGFSLLELLVVIGIIAVFLALLLPAVQKVRSAALRMKCQNNLRQLGLALHNYHGAQQAFPPGCSYQGGSDPYPHLSWLARLLPYLEQEALWQQIGPAFARDRFFLGPPPHPGLSQPVALFICPVDTQASQPWDVAWDTGNFRVAFTSYLGVSGTNHSSGDGVLYLDSRVRLTDILNGTSNTVTAGERPPSANHDLGWWYAGWGQDRGGSAESHLGVREVNVHPQYPQCGAGPFGFQPGQVTNSCDAFHFWSLHPGGAHFLFADGSVRFLGYEADPLLVAMAVRAPQ
jgi:prepilin-type N-terminal cleavage/methylation domain-containing protein/prepilin-type processing-associated H-X9-DG protein